jgi:hypothetical protein
MDKKKGKPKETTRKTVGTKAEPAASGTAKVAAVPHMPSIAAMLLDRSRRRITSS